ncbi:death-on-curing protein [Thalassobaculum fulvum]|uniref:Death-on-curing protein n=1 Tax=Thalassobaculum fulvum TaxID=1633335 RepID=A0A918XYP2_9PROT|nr:type II toxin-antitoxin system death-on-curing family toxin [Thalassobaculum fulvum]GHD63810.1 death-on-curing protein [Thalassobaculum fulvum]
MSAWTRVRADVVLAIHDEQIAEHGGAPGIRDRAVIESALARPKNLADYGEPSPDAAALAAAYAYGIARNHGFMDGNKRTAFVVALVFLLNHGWALIADDAEAVRVMLATAAGTITEADLADWFRQNSASLPA